MTRAGHPYPAGSESPPYPAQTGSGTSSLREMKPDPVASFRVAGGGLRWRVRVLNLCLVLNTRTRDLKNGYWRLAVGGWECRKTANAMSSHPYPMQSSATRHPGLQPAT
jgi:hypothetical protein